MTDLALCPHLTGGLALYDVDRAAAERNVRLARRMFNEPMRANRAVLVGW